MHAIQTMIKSAYQKHTALLVATLITILALKLIVLAPPLLLGTIIDTLHGDKSVASDTLLMLAAGLIVAGCIHSILNPLQIHVLCKLVQHIVMTASIDWIRSLIRKEFVLFDAWRMGHLIKSVERGITAHEQLLTFLITVALPVCLEFVVVGGAFLYMGGSAVFLSMTGLGVLYLLVTHKIIRWRRKHIDAVNEQEDELSARLYSTLSAGKAIKLECAESTAMLPLNQAFERYATAAVTTASSGGLLSAAKILFVSLSTGGLLCWGIVDQLSGQPSISVGQLVAIFSIAGTYLISIATLTEGYRVLDQFLADQRQFQSLLSLADFDHCERRAVMDFQGDSILSLAPCAVTENGEPRLSIKQSLIFTQGQSVAITGPSGAGKSTFLKVLAGLDALTRDHLNIDSVSVSLLTRQSHLTALRYCPQQPQFLEGFFESSVLFGSDASPLLSQAIRQLQLEEVMDRHISENVANISGGEAKRLSLLRLINKPGKFNLFDEPSASIEPRLTGPLWDLLFEVFADRGLICVTHDVEHLHRFDRVIVMDGGAIVDDGPWRELVSRPAVKLLLDEIRH
ncbi:ATP-binding cassette domain-containing protein [Pseudomonas mediterranea]|uniref:ATP-binding cassette domain-containing protein n=1 Tax=Pseudomonas mediterranea TaxID=183795 RepID=UPI0006D8CD30|nr:ATP-binding cassette domain-containing protein [Pseudomonas mediterranea]MBL0845854.1 ATP-binding cassette domain-containing protein [Pseudomonas mediterranea]MDU9030718.1 ATP-binding cassette domain-containing protein [Pseudomonas mediterranea]UZE03323.1 ATP-binding cassette domain-containing protein [Pseudomonas mediterranea]